MKNSTKIRKLAAKLEIKIRKTGGEWWALLGSGHAESWQRVGGDSDIISALEGQSGIKI